MKKLFFLTLLCSILLTCKKDETTDPCFGISCQNGGTCVNGVCDCPERYEGPDCSDQKTPTTIRITGVNVTAFPPLDPNSQSWDVFDGPDIFIVVLLGGVELYSNSANFIEDASSNQDYLFSPISINLTNPTDQYTISLYDYDDFDADDYIGGFDFTPYWDFNGFPTQLNLNSSGYPTSFEVDISYEF